MNRHEEESRCSALADEKRGELRECQLLRANQKAEERRELRSRINYCRAAKSTLNHIAVNFQEDNDDRNNGFHLDKNLCHDLQSEKSNGKTKRELREVLIKLEKAVMSQNKKMET